MEKLAHGRCTQDPVLLERRKILQKGCGCGK
jgi:hypothetical protein